MYHTIGRNPINKQHSICKLGVPGWLHQPPTGLPAAAHVGSLAPAVGTIHSASDVHTLCQIHTIHNNI